MKTLRLIFYFSLLFILSTACENSAEPGDAKPAVYTIKSNSGYTLMRNGEAFLIKGAAAQPEYLEELKNAGANTVRIYDTLNLEKTLNYAEELGLAVVVDIPLPNYTESPEYYEDLDLFNNLKNKVLGMVKKHKDHPALLYWNLGNEVKFPEFYQNLNFFSNYRSLVDDIHTEDGEHPVSTTVAGASRKRLRSMILRKTNLDFFSFNIFGGISEFPDQLGLNKYFWDGQFVISEWGINGPWENGYTAWGAPIEETSTKKAEQIKERYINYIQPLEEKGSLGNLTFYWGEKNEVTPTWFSLFGEDGKKTQAVFELANIWKNREDKFPGPVLNFILLNEKGDYENIILTPGSKAETSVYMPEEQSHNNLNYRWELRHESWYEPIIGTLINGINFSQLGTNTVFNVPVEEGPYRLFLYLTNDSEYFATANIPFYVLNPKNGE